MEVINFLVHPVNFFIKFFDGVLEIGLELALRVHDLVHFLEDVTKFAILRLMLSELLLDKL